VTEKSINHPTMHHILPDSAWFCHQKAHQGSAGPPSTPSQGAACFQSGGAHADAPGGRLHFPERTPNHPPRDLSGDWKL